MRWIKRKGYRLIMSYILAVWMYGIIFAMISGVYPPTAIDWIKFLLMPLFLTLQLPRLFMAGHGWLFVIVAGILWVGFYYLLKRIADKKEAETN